MLGWTATVYRGGRIVDPNEFPYITDGERITGGYIDKLPESLLFPFGPPMEGEVIKKGDYPSLYRIPAGRLQPLLQEIDFQRQRRRFLIESKEKTAVEAVDTLNLAPDELVYIEVWDES